MSTRCTLTFRDSEGETFSIYRHYDGAPKDVLADLPKAFTFAWPLPRFEASEFAAAVIAAWKAPRKETLALFGGAPYVSQGGYIYVVANSEACDDTAFHYLVEPHPTKRGALRATAFERLENGEWSKGRAHVVSSDAAAKPAPSPRDALLNEAFAYQAHAFANDESVDGGDLVAWFAEWRMRVYGAL